MGSLNRVMLIGNLGRDAEVRYTPGGAAVAKFSLATTESWTDKSGNKQSKTEWHTVDLWGKSAEALSEYLVKGKQVYVEGKIQTEEWTDKDGQKRKTTKVRAERIVLLGGGERQSHSDSEAAAEFIARELTKAGAVVKDSYNNVDDDSIPF